MNTTMHPCEKAQADLADAQRRFARMQNMIADKSIPAPDDITKTPAYLVLKDAERAAQFFNQCEAVDDTAQISTTLTEGMATLRAEGLRLVGWIDWSGGECPFAPGALVDVKLRHGGTHFNAKCFDEGPAANTYWAHIGWDQDIVAYRVVPMAAIASREAAEVAA